MRIDEIAEPGAEWDAFVEATPGATVGHAAGWSQVLARAYGLQPLYLAARGAGGELRGVLPLVRFRTISGRRELISLPYLDAAGVLASEPEAAEALVEGALAHCRRGGFRSLELRQTARLPGQPEPDAGHRVDLVLRLEADPEAQWKRVGSKVRNQTRKAERAGLTLATGGHSLLDAFYGPFSVNMRDLGSPVHARAFFRCAAEVFGERLRFVVTQLGERPVGGLVAIAYAGSVTVPWASTLRSERGRCPNNQIYWEALRWAIERGAREFDFGRSPVGSGTHRFKLGWGAEERPLAWARLAPDGSPLSVGGGEGSALETLSAWWTRLPSTLATRLGPRVRRYFAN